MTIMTTCSFQDLPPLVKHMLSKYIVPSAPIPFCALQTEGIYEQTLYTAVVLSKNELLLATLFQPGGMSDGLLEMIDLKNVTKVHLKRSKKESVVEIHSKELDFSLFGILHASTEQLSKGGERAKRANPDKKKLMFDTPELAEAFIEELNKLA